MPVYILVSFKDMSFFSKNMAHQDLNHLEKGANIFDKFELFCHYVCIGINELHYLYAVTPDLFFFHITKKKSTLYGQCELFAITKKILTL